MDPIIKKQRIASLILKEKIDELSKSEKEELTSWLQASPKNKKIYARLQEKSFSEDIARYQQISTTRGLDNYRRRYVQTNKRLLGKWYWAAAVAVFIIGIATLFFYQEEHPTVAKTTISPGSSKAMLILNNGEIISLSEKNKTEIVATEELSIRNEGSRLRYTASENTKNEQANNYNELIVPKGGEFTLTLSDGTKVWLNSQSKIRYPVIFNDITREVYLEGEAYFEVQHDDKLPFIVNTSKSAIRVYGTSFNVKAYPDDSFQKTTLEEGSIGLQVNDKEFKLVPNQQAVLNTANEVNVIKIKARQQSAWRHGRFLFDNENLEDIMAQLARWYDVNIFFVGPKVKNLHFSGEIDRYENIEKVLHMIGLTTNISFSINGKTITITPE